MNWLSIITAISQNAPTIIKVVSELTSSLKQTTGAAQSTPSGVLAVRAPSETVKAVQKLLNLFVKPQPPLAEDGWLGPKTEKAINDGIAMARPYLAMFGLK